MTKPPPQHSSEPPDNRPDDDPDNLKPLRRQVEVLNKKGLHARAAAKFVKMAEQFETSITVEREGTRVPGTSIMGLLMLAAGRGSNILIEAEGPQSEAAMAALINLIDSKFDED